jgi:hypothetical protein
MLSKYISEQEFTTTRVRGINNNLPDGVIRKNALNLCKSILDIIRDYYNKPLIITSGYRCDKVNSAIGGAKTSQHRFGNAVDFYVVGINLKQIFNDISTGKIKSTDGKPLMNLIDQMIIENLDSNNNTYSGSWLHIGRSSKPRHQKMLAKFIGGKPNYVNIVTI